MRAFSMAGWIGVLHFVHSNCYLSPFFDKKLAFLRESGPLEFPVSAGL